MEFISNCFQVFFFKDLDEFINILKSIIVRKMQKTGDSKILPKYINTLAGKIKIMVEVETHIMEKESTFFHYIIHSKKNHDPSFLQNIHIYIYIYIYKYYVIYYDKNKIYGNICPFFI